MLLVAASCEDQTDDEDDVELQSRQCAVLRFLAFRKVLRHSVPSLGWIQAGSARSTKLATVCRAMWSRFCIGLEYAPAGAVLANWVTGHL